jgi:hypothetical protein
MKCSTVVAIGVDRHRVGRDNGLFRQLPAGDCARSPSVLTRRTVR